MENPNQQNLDEYLAHYGVAGMKWGVRKTKSQRLQDRSEKLMSKSVKLNAKSDKLKMKSDRVRSKVDSAKIDLATVNKKIADKNNDLNYYTNKSAKLGSKTEKIQAKKGNVEKIGNKKSKVDGKISKIEEQLKPLTNKSESLQARIQPVEAKADLLKSKSDMAKSKSIKLSQKAEKKYKKVMKMKPDPDAIARYEELFGTIAHYGIPGMKWGVRKARTGATSVSELLKRRKAKKEKEAGSNPEINKTLASKQVRKMSSKKAQAQSVAREKEWTKVYRNRSRMTNEELTKAVNRLELENRMQRAVQSASEFTKPGPTATQQAMKRIRGVAVVSTKIAPAVLKSLPQTKENQNMQQAIKVLETAGKVLNATGKKD